MRFGKIDIEIYTKKRGQDEQYKLAKFEDICDVQDIPKFYFNIKWRRKNEQGERRREDLRPDRGKPTSMCASSNYKKNT